MFVHAPSTDGRPAILRRTTLKTRTVMTSAMLLAAALVVATIALPATRADAAPSSTTYSIWPSSTSPKGAAASEQRAVELGVQFSASTTGWVKAIKYYKFAQESPATKGTLWSSSGQVLAQANFSSPTNASGWQTANLSSPIKISPNTTYVVSYNAPKGQYAADQGALSSASPVKNNGLTATRGVYNYSLGYPTQSWNNTNYYADLQFSPDVVGTTSAPAATSAQMSRTSTAAPSATPAPTGTSPKTTTPATSASSASAFPTAATTGVPAGVTLKPSGSLTINTAGTVIDALDINGTVSINASNVTIKRSRISGSSFAVVWIKSGLTGITIQDTEINGRGLSGTAGSMGIYGPANVQRTNIYGVENGIAPASGSILDGNYIHSLASPGSPHYDGLQLDGGQSNVTITNNTVDVSDYNQTSAVMIDNYFGPISNITVQGNRLLGGGYTVYSDGGFTGGSITGVKILNNRIGKGYYGPALIRNNVVTWTGNVNDSTGAAITNY